MTSYKNLVRFSSVGFKKLPGFAEAIWKSAKPTPYFEGTKTFFIEKGTKMNDSLWHGNNL